MRRIQSQKENSKEVKNKTFKMIKTFGQYVKGDIVTIPESHEYLKKTIEVEDGLKKKFIDNPAYIQFQKSSEEYDLKDYLKKKKARKEAEQKRRNKEGVIPPSMEQKVNQAQNKEHGEVNDSDKK